jgi:hypothetical protein
MQEGMRSRMQGMRVRMRSSARAGADWLDVWEKDVWASLGCCMRSRMQGMRVRMRSSARASLGCCWRSEAEAVVHRSCLSSRSRFS